MNISIDNITQTATRGKFARICVQLSINNPLSKRIKIATFWQSLVYENIPVFCTRCGRIGHILSSRLESPLNSDPGHSETSIKDRLSMTPHTESDRKMVTIRKPRPRVTTRDAPMRLGLTNEDYPPKNNRSTSGNLKPIPVLTMQPVVNPSAESKSNVNSI